VRDKKVLEGFSQKKQYVFTYKKKKNIHPPLPFLNNANKKLFFFFFFFLGL